MSIKAWEHTLHEHGCCECGKIEVSPHPTENPNAYLCGNCFEKDWREKTLYHQSLNRIRIIYRGLDDV